MSELEPGQIVMYLDRYGFVTKYYGNVYYYTDTAKVYFFDTDKEMLLDRSVLKPIHGKGLEDFNYVLLKFCDCGEKHVDKPSTHSHWCRMEKLKRGKVNESTKSNSK